MEEKQRRLDAAKRALSALSTAYVTWPGIGSEVFLAGSFDGWTTQVYLAIQIDPFYCSLFVFFYLKSYEYFPEEDGEIQRRSLLANLDALPRTVRGELNFLS